MIQILCNVSTFDLHQQIVLVDTKEKISKIIGVTDVDKLSADIVAACAKYAVGKVVLRGNKTFVDVFADEIKTIGKTKYGINNLEVEVI